MRFALMASAVVLAATAILGGATAPASAQGLSLHIGPGGGVSLGFGYLDPNVIAYGYSDGYWDRFHHWHVWGPGQARYFREHYREHYVEHRHDFEHGGGWRGDEWWHGREDHRDDHRDDRRDHDRHDDHR